MWLYLFEARRQPVEGLIANETVDADDLAFAHPLTRFATFTEPSPVARSYATPDWNFAPEVPNPTSPGTALFPTVTSLKIQLGDKAAVVLEPLHPEYVSCAASLYRT